MTEYQIQPQTRRCAATGRELQAGERYYTARLEDGDQFVRQDFSSEARRGLSSFSRNTRRSILRASGRGTPT